MASDVRVALRSLLRSRWYFVCSVFVLALGITLTVLTVAIVDGVLFKPLPYPRADELYLIRADVKARPLVAPPAVSWDEIAVWRAAVPDFPIGVAEAAARRVPEIGGVDLFQVHVDDQFFGVVGMAPFIGGFTPDDHALLLGGRVVQPQVISYRLWQSAHQGRPEIVGQTIPVGESRGTLIRRRIAGVLPQAFVFPSTHDQATPDIITPAGPVRLRRSAADARTLQAFIRIPDPGTTARVRTRLLAALSELAPRVSSSSVAFDEVSLVPLAEHLGQRERPIFRAILAGAALLLLLACANVAGLAVARAAAHERGIVLRRALGASTWRLARYQIIELAVMTIPASTAAVALLPTLLGITVRLLPSSLVLLKVPTVDGRVIAAAVTATTASLVLTSLWPVYWTRRPALSPDLNAYGRAGGTGARGTRLLVAGQTAVGVVLLTGGALAGGSLAVVLQEDTGYDKDGLAVVEAYAAFYPTQEAAHRQVLGSWERLRRVPGVEDVAMSSGQPTLDSPYTRPYTIWAPRHAPRDTEGVSSRFVSANYFRVIGLDPVEGSWPDPAIWDADGPVAVVSESAARRWWPGQSPIGQTLVTAVVDWPRRPLEPKTVVAVVPDARYVALDREPLVEIYTPYRSGEMQIGALFFVRTDRPAESVMPELLEVLGLERLRVSQASSIQDALFKSVRRRALLAWLFGLFGFAALTILATGILGLLALTAVHRVREMGVRIALGSTRAALVWLLIAEQLKPVAAGLGAGVVVALWTSQLLRSHLYGLSPFDVPVWLAVIGTIILTAIAGTLIPSVRITASDPTQSLRSE